MTLLPSDRPSLARRLAAAGCATVASFGLALGGLVPAGAQTSAPPERLTPAQKQKVFPERKALILKQQQERQKIQEKGQRCAKAANDDLALRKCMKEEREAHQKLRSQNREEMRRIYERKGIKAPVGGPEKGKKKGKGSTEV